MLLAVSYLLPPAAIAPTTTVLILVAALVIVVVLLRAGRPRLRAEPTSPQASEPEPRTTPTTAHDWPHDEERFRTPLDQVENYAIVLLDRAGKPTSWNPGIRRVLGYERAEFLESTAEDLYPSDDRQRGAPASDLAEAEREGRYTTDRWLLRRDGSRFWGSLSTTSVQDAEGRLLGFARRVRDLSQHKEVEEQLRLTQDALELALDAAGLGAWEHDLSTGVLAMDVNARTLFGLAAEERVTMRRCLEALHPDDRERALEHWERDVRDRAQYSDEYRVIWPDGSVHWVMAVGRSGSDLGNGSARRFSGVVIDLTERRRTEEHLQESLRLEAVGRLAGGIAHDLNNMLAAILGFGDLLGRSLEPGDPRAGDVEQIMPAATRSAGLTHQLLAFARREMIQPRALDINAVIHHVHALLPPILGENVELELRLAPDLGAVYADPRQIEQTVMNLVLNARDAMPQGGQVTIETSTVQLGPGTGAWVSEEGRFTMLSIADTGHGMDAATLHRIWEPFFTTKPPGKGTGLGLASVYGAAKQSGGFVWADSEPGRGTTVQVYWPEIGAPVETSAEPERAPTLVGGSETVLIVEDEELVRALAVRALRGFGYACHQARDAAEALRLLVELEIPVDLVVTDVVLPGMSGGELGKRLAQRRPRIPVLYTSAFTDAEVIRRGMLGEGRPFLQKPFTPNELARMVRETLDAAGRLKKRELVE